MSVENLSIPTALSAILTTQLQLQKRIENALVRAHIETVGEIVVAFEQGMTQVRGIGVSGIEEVRKAIIALTSCLQQEEIVDWPCYYDKMGIEASMISPNFSAMPVLPDDVLALSIGQLHLSLKSYNALIKVNITTIGGALSAFENRFDGVEGIGAATLELLTQRFQGLADTVSVDGSLDWFLFWQNQEITIIPKTFQSGAPIGQIIKQLPGVIKEILLQDDDDRDWRIIERRFGLHGNKQLTLEEIGQTFGLTRERVRQIEKKGLAELRSVLMLGQYIGRNYRVHPEIVASIKILFDAVATQARELMPETDLFALTERVWQTDVKKSGPLLVLMFSLAEMERIEFGDADLTPIWEVTPSSQRELMVKVVSQIDHLLTSTTGQAMDEFDLLRHVNKELPKGQKVTALQLRRFIEFCNTIEQRADSLYQGKFRYLKSRGHQAERILLEAGKPLTVAEMAREINSRTVPFGARKLDSRNLGNHVLADNRFMSIGRTGIWALRAWDHIDTASIVDLMERCLMERNTPATIGDIFEYINNRRPVTTVSIGMYLTLRGDLFRRVDRMHWGLASWAEAQSIWDPEAVATFVAGLFKQQKVKELEFRVVSKALSKAANVTVKQAQGMLNVNPIIETRRESWDKAYAVLQDDYREKLATKGARFMRKQATLGDTFTTAVREVIERQPGKEMVIGALIAQLVDHHGYKRPTAYTYLSRVDFIEKVTVPGSRTVICRLKGQNSLAFPQVEEIPDTNIRAEIKRAIQNMTLDNVDIGLFLLGRQFEVVIKRALLKGSRKGAITLPAGLGPDPAKWKLVQMVDAAKPCGLITDLGVANLLRQERNDRAHGDPPTLNERQALLNSVQYLAGLYIDYILIFSKHEQSWT